MTFKAKLFSLFCTADEVVCEGYVCEDVGMTTPEVFRLTLDDMDWHFADQEVTVDISGEVQAVLMLDDDAEPGDEPDEITLQFRVSRPINEGDLK